MLGWRWCCNVVLPVLCITIFRWFYRHIALHTLHTSRRELVGYVGASTPSISIKWASFQIGFGIFFNKYSKSMDLHHLGSMFFHHIFFSEIVGCRSSSQSFQVSVSVTTRLARWKAWMTQKHVPEKTPENRWFEYISCSFLDLFQVLH